MQPIDTTDKTHFQLEIYYSQTNIDSHEIFHLLKEINYDGNASKEETLNLKDLCKQNQSLNQK